MADDIKKKDVVNGTADATQLGAAGLELAEVEGGGPIGLAAAGAQAGYNYVKNNIDASKTYNNDLTTFDNAPEDLAKKLPGAWDKTVDQTVQQNILPTVTKQAEAEYQETEQEKNNRLQWALNRVDAQTFQSTNPNKNQVLDAADETKRNLETQTREQLQQTANENPTKVATAVQNSVNQLNTQDTVTGQSAFNGFRQNFEKSADKNLEEIQDQTERDELKLNQAKAPWQVYDNWSADKTRNYSQNAKKELDAKKTELHQKLNTFTPPPANGKKLLDQAGVNDSALTPTPNVSTPLSTTEFVAQNTERGNTSYRGAINGGKNGTIEFTDQAQPFVSTDAIKKVKNDVPQYQRVPDGAFGSADLFSGQKLDISTFQQNPDKGIKETGTKKIRDLPDLTQEQTASLTAPPTLSRSEDQGVEFGPDLSAEVPTP